MKQSRNFPTYWTYFCCALAVLLSLAGCGGSQPGTVTSQGCGTAAKFTSGKFTLTSDGVSRDFWVDVPADYDPKVAHPLVVGLHWRGGSATDVYGTGDGAFFGLKKLYGNAAVFVAPQGLDAGWANYGDRDIRFVRTMVEQLKQGMCLDTSRVYAVGFSFGGMMSNAIGCQMGDMFRAVAPIAGSLWSGCTDSPNRVAAIFVHSRADNVVGYQAGEEARDKFLVKNACTTANHSIGNNGCVEYEGCATGYPVTWCGFDGGGHWPPGFAAAEIKTFFDRF